MCYNFFNNILLLIFYFYFVSNYFNKRKFNSNDDTCIICLEKFKYPILLNCGHNYCVEYIYTNFKKNKKCPICRKII